MKKTTPSTDPGPFRSRSLAPIAWAVGLVLTGALLLAYFAAPDYRPVKVVERPGSEVPIPPPPPAPTALAAATPTFVEPETPNDPLGLAGDLKAVYMRYKDSRDPIERAIAGRAHRACFPMFLPPLGLGPSPEHALNAMPAAQRAARRPAVEALFKRCASFLTQPINAAEIVGTAERVTNGDLATPGALVRWATIRGDRRGAERMLALALASKNPYAIESLSGLSAVLQEETNGAAAPETTDAALALLACDLGAACGHDSLIALQLCATEGRCRGSARERMLERVGPVDLRAVDEERARLRKLLEGGAAAADKVWPGR